jgi:hypothetical protein
MSAALELAQAIEEGRVQRLHVTTSAPDRLFDAMVAAGAKPEHPVRDRMECNRGGRLRWRQGSVIVNGCVVLISTEMTPVQRDPYVEAVAVPAPPASSLFITPVNDEDGTPPVLVEGGG